MPTEHTENTEAKGECGVGHPAYNRMGRTETAEVASELAPTGGKEKEERERFFGAFLEADAAVFHLAAVTF